MTSLSRLAACKAKNLGLRALVCALPLVGAAPVLAQDDDADEAADDDEAADADAEPAADSAGAADPSDAPTGEKPVLEETIYVVQGKPFLAQGHFEITPQIAQSVNDSFTSHTGLMVSGLYHLKENVALEATIGVFGWWDEPGVTTPRLGGRDTDLTVELKQKENLAPERVKLYQFPYVVAGNLQWSPLYGKVNVQEFALGQFNLYLSVGAGIMGLQLETLTPGIPNKNFVTLQGPGGVLPPMALTTSFGGGLRFYFSEWLGVRVELRDYVTPLSVFQSGENAVDDADAPSFDVTNTVLAQLGVSFVF